MVRLRFDCVNLDTSPENALRLRFVASEPNPRPVVCDATLLGRGKGRNYHNQIRATTRLKPEADDTSIVLGPRGGQDVVARRSTASRDLPRSRKCGSLYRRREYTHKCTMGTIGLQLCVEQQGTRDKLQIRREPPRVQPDLPFARRNSFCAHRL
jgi:hypothetical protein